MEIPITFKYSKLPNVFRLLYRILEPNLLFDNTDTFAIWYSEEFWRLKLLDIITFPETYNSSFILVLPITYKLFKLPI